VSLSGVLHGTFHSAGRVKEVADGRCWTLRLHCDAVPSHLLKQRSGQQRKRKKPTSRITPTLAPLPNPPPEQPSKPKVPFVSFEEEQRRLAQLREAAPPGVRVTRRMDPNRSGEVVDSASDE
jgi:hypothetical protein